MLFGAGRLQYGLSSFQNHKAVEHSVGTNHTEDRKPDEESWGTPNVRVNRRTWRSLNVAYRLLGRRSVSKSWARASNPQIEFNFDSLTLSQIGLRQPATELNQLGLGPADEFYGEGCRSLHYNDLGLWVTSSDTTGIYHIMLKWWECANPLNFVSREKRYKPFAGKCLFKGQHVELCKETRRESVIKSFGEPTCGYDEDGVLQIAYKVSGGEYAFIFEDFKLGDRTLSVVVVTPSN
ncbi:hypothetical protein Pla144_51050 [Bythopirellula polymerisocia]|uniref:Uncharacterized protein n=1 Tax=Bythopirellula polymerisocia TaxID=2528003 RepID=A0A5C6BZD1_9BACT|nr:hypothetical protein Pla144_51050 [Bythopirellula polymerisocia]